nr:MAG TPA: hypothetical protein [Caudoviricetes sp.]
MNSYIFLALSPIELSHTGCAAEDNSIETIYKGGIFCVV